MVMSTPSLVSGPKRDAGRSRAQSKDLAAVKHRTLKQAALDRQVKCLALSWIEANAIIGMHMAEFGTFSPSTPGATAEALR
jgi:hypothetical protein